MSWSFKLGRFAGVDVRIHITFFLLVAFIGFTGYLNTGTAAGAFDSVLYILALFGCVLLHEYGHVLAARQFNIPTHDITLYPIGGVARLERMPDKPLQELWVALAGPLVNVVIAAGLFVLLALSGGLSPLGQVSLMSGSLAERLMYVNVSLVLFNLLPAFPMDGGRVVRALLATRLEYVRATQIAATLGQGMALLFGFVGLFGNPLLIFVAFFVWMAASQEASLVQMKGALGGIPVSRAMLTNFRTLHPLEPVGRAVEHLIAGTQQDFPVVDDMRVVGILTRADLLAALSRQGEVGLVGHIMQRQFPTVDAYDMLEGVFVRLQAQHVHVAPVLHNGQLVGLLTLENVGEFLMVQSALEATRRARQRWQTATW